MTVTLVFVNILMVVMTIYRQVNTTTPKTLHSKHGHREFVCEQETLKIACRDNEVIEITSAAYGRSHPNICPGINEDATYCHAANKSLSVVKKNCDGKQHCAVIAANEVFGDPCYGTYKYLDVTYICKSPPEIVCEHGTLKIACRDNEVIDIMSAAYGRSNATVCPGVNQQDTNCHAAIKSEITTATHGQSHQNNCPRENATNCPSASKSLTIVKHTCDGKQSCSVRASNYVFGDPCYGTFKYLQVSYTCKTEETSNIVCLITRFGLTLGLVMPLMFPLIIALVCLRFRRLPPKRSVVTPPVMIPSVVPEFSTSKITVAIIDTGFKVDHGSFTRSRMHATIVENVSFDVDKEDHDNHGTAVMHVLVKNITVPNLKLILIKMDSRKRTPKGLVEAINYLIQWKKENQAPIHVVNLSVASWKHSDALQKAMLNVCCSSVVVTAASNDGHKDSNSIWYPSLYGGSIVMGAHGVGYKPTYFSPQGEQLTFLGPGCHEDIASTNSSSATQSVEGTSFSVPYMCGLIVNVLFAIYCSHGDYVMQQMATTHRMKTLLVEYATEKSNHTKRKGYGRVKHEEIDYESLNYMINKKKAELGLLS